MTCIHDPSELLLLLYLEANETEARILQARLNHCAVCRQAFIGLQEGQQLLQGLAFEDASEALLRGIEKRIRPKSRLFWLKPLLLAASLVLISLVATRPWTNSSLALNLSAPSDAQIEAISNEIEQLSAELNSTQDWTIDDWLKDIESQLEHLHNEVQGDSL